MKTSSVCLLFLFVCLFCSCEKEHEPDPDPEPTPEELWERAIAEDFYEFQKIEYFLEEGDEMEIVMEETLPFTVQNETLDEVTFSSKPFNNKFDLSCFTPDPEHSFPEGWRVEDGIEVKTPAKIIENDVYVNLSFMYPYEDFVSHTRLASEVENTIDVKPGTKFRVYYELEKYKMHVTYTAIFRGQNTGNVVTVKGKWSGDFYSGRYNTYGTWDDI